MASARARELLAGLAKLESSLQQLESSSRARSEGLGSSLQGLQGHGMALERLGLSEGLGAACRACKGSGAACSNSGVASGPGWKGVTCLAGELVLLVSWHIGLEEGGLRRGHGRLTLGHPACRQVDRFAPGLFSRLYIVSKTV